MATIIDGKKTSSDIKAEIAKETGATLTIEKAPATIRNVLITIFFILIKKPLFYYTCTNNIKHVNFIFALILAYFKIFYN